MTTLPLAGDSPEMQAWYAEIHGIADGIVRWLDQYPGVCEVIVRMYDIGHTTMEHDFDAGYAIADAGEALLFKLMGAASWLNFPDHYFDTWQCGFHEAMERIK